MARNATPRPPVTKSPLLEDALLKEQTAAGVTGFIEGVKHVLNTTSKDRPMRSMTAQEAEYIVVQVIGRYTNKRAEQRARSAPPSDPVADLWTA